MPSFTPDWTRSLFAGGLVMNPIIIPICIMNLFICCGRCGISSAIATAVERPLNTGKPRDDGDELRHLYGTVRSKTTIWAETSALVQGVAVTASPNYSFLRRHGAFLI